MFYVERASRARPEVHLCLTSLKHLLYLTPWFHPWFLSALKQRASTFGAETAYISICVCECCPWWEGSMRVCSWSPPGRGASWECRDSASLAWCSLFVQPSNQIPFNFRRNSSGFFGFVFSCIDNVNTAARQRITVTIYTIWKLSIFWVGTDVFKVLCIEVKKKGYGHVIYKCRSKLKSKFLDLVGMWKSVC